MLNVRVINRLPKAEKIIKQLRYGTAVGLTKLAKEGQAASVGAIKGTFTTRGTWYQQNMKHGIKITPATPARLRSEVKTLADWLEPHETGRDKTARGGRSIAVPTENVRRNKRMIIPRAQRPKGLGAKAFVIQTSAGPALVQRMLRGKNKGLKFLYFFEPRVKIKKRSTFYEPIEKAVKRRGRAIIAREQREALRAMR